MTSRVLVSLRVAATAGRAFEAFTREIGTWWTPSALFQFVPGATGRVSLEAGVGGRFVEAFANGDVFEIGRVTVWEPGCRLGFTWRQATFTDKQLTHVEVRFEALGPETRVTVEHSGWQSVPQDHVARHGFPDTLFLRRHAEWWQMQLAGLKHRSSAAAGGNDANAATGGL